MELSDLSTEPDQAGIEQREADEALNRELAKMKQFCGHGQIPPGCPGDFVQG